ncbi:putative multi-domain containing protein, partial [Aduncisulcus paluster]
EVHDGQTVARFSLAIDKVLSSEKKEAYEREGKPTADFPRIVAWGRRADMVSKYLKKGDQVGISGSVATGSYSKEDGTKVYTTSIVVSNIKFMNNGPRMTEPAEAEEDDTQNIPF